MSAVDLDRLARLAGIEPAFSDYFGTQTRVGDQTKRELLTAMGFDVASTASTEAAIRALENDCGGASKSAGRCYVAPALKTGRIWAVATQLYALRSQHNWGMGDFTDLQRLATCAGSAGAGAVALNPLHELHPMQPEGCSPYSPSSRRWINPLYVDVTRVPDFHESPEARRFAADEIFDECVARLRASELVDYSGVARLKRAAFELLFTSFHERHLQRPGDARAAAFRGFLRQGGVALERLGVYQALTEFFHARDGTFGWLQWPAEFRYPEAPAVARFAREHRDRVAFYWYLQWIAAEQLAETAAVARDCGVGLYLDLAVGVDRNGADAWADQEAILERVSLGAPPDAMNVLGQNWGLPPLSPRTLRAREYAPLAELLAANMRHARILRIDHVMALRRAFWIPLGAQPRDGAYVDYGFEAMLGVVAAESTRHECTIVGEDLGTLPDGFRERMREAATFSSRLLYFERDFHDGRFHPPSAYPELAAASVGTHDLPPLAGWWTGADVALRERIGLFPGEQSARDAFEERRHARWMLIEAFEREGVADVAEIARLRDDAAAGGTQAVFETLVSAAYRYLAKTPARLIVVALEDVLGEAGAVNVPGTTTEHPNWRRKHLLPLEEIERKELLKEIGSLFDDAGM
ncbi:MAG: 4-alpha-glucanotransferase [Candidatus Eremiobacteraeota bacterium]|nr:4-alpha-glucanotransferase [Candidatus Eremiobacteraeota bacterium]